ncbi:MAG: GNAT family N-acetyltransferase [Chloroflexota bacterium]
MFAARFTTPDDPAARLLVAQLNATLQTLTGDDGSSSYSPEAFDVAKDAFVVLEREGTAVACGALRWLENKTWEIKRMYSTVPGGGGHLLQVLEAKAAALGCEKLVLSTRIVNTQAVQFYLRHGYVEVAPYGKYTQTQGSVCLGKMLT